MPTRVSPAALAIGIALAALATDAPAQPGAPFTQPGDLRPELPDFEPDERPRTRILPPVEPGRGPDLGPLLGGVRVFVRGYRVVGGTVLGDADIEAITAPFSNRPVAFAELEMLRDRLTLAYIERGYLTSGAVIPDQEIVDGIVELRLVEGRVARTEVRSDGRLDPEYVEGRVERGTAPPVNVNTLEEQLQILQQDRRIETVAARLRPAEVRGESVLDLDVAEARPYDFDVEIGNLESPSVGGTRIRTSFRHWNLSGRGDSLFVSHRWASGLNAVDGVYSLPLSADDTRLEIYGEAGRSKVVEAPLEALQVEGDFYTLGGAFRHPVHRTRESRLELSLGGDFRRSESQLLDFPFSFTPGENDGVARVFVVRFRQDWSHRGATQALSARSTLSVGTGLFGATDNPGDVPDGQFIAWLGQVQWARRLPVRDIELLARADLQISNDALLPLEQIAVGGMTTVRGYRERTVIGDNGFIGSVELRVPVLHLPTHQLRVELAPFFDAGRSWNKAGVLDAVNLVSVGIGARASLARRSVFEVYWAYALSDRVDRIERDLQDDGVHLRLFWAF